MTRTGRLLAIVVATLSLSTAAFANDYPNAPVTLIVPYPAGTGTDSFARIFARSLEARLGQRFVVDNKPGANGMNGSDVASRAKPDGYTLSQIPGTVFTLPLMQDTTWKADDFSYIIQVTGYNRRNSCGEAKARAART